MKLRRADHSLFKGALSFCLVQEKMGENRTTEKMVEALMTRSTSRCLKILRKLTKYVRLDLAGSQAKIQSAVHLSPKEKSLVKKRIFLLRKRDLEVQFEVNPEVLGGLRIQIGSEIWDGTILSHLG